MKKSQNVHILIEVLGWYGAAAILAAYFFNSFAIISNTRLVYQLLNVTGAVGICAVSYKKKAYQPLAINVIWFFIGGIAVFNILF